MAKRASPKWVIFAVARELRSVAVLKTATGRPDEGNWGARRCPGVSSARAGRALVHRYSQERGVLRSPNLQQRSNNQKDTPFGGCADRIVPS
jgi:hypothetical protein